MKKIILGLITIVMLSLNGFANNLPSSINESSVIKQTNQEVLINYSYGTNVIKINKTFNARGSEMKSFINEEFDKMVANFKEVSNTDLLNCSVTVRVGTSSNYIEVTISGECSEVVKAAAKIKKELMKAL